MEDRHQTVLIIGAGIAGLALAQGLKKVCNTTITRLLIPLIDKANRKGFHFLFLKEMHQPRAGRRDGLSPSTSAYHYC